MILVTQNTAFLMVKESLCFRLRVPEGEQCFGKYEGTPRDGAEFRISKTHFADRYDGGESMMQLAQRIYNLLDELRQDENKTYLLVAHNGIARVVESYFHDMTNEEYALAGIRNCELVEYHFD
mgnify:CR=1 FL=1